ncbi:hypothetical protein Tco_1269816, partial [Tanacetum coccineum]
MARFISICMAAFTSRLAILDFLFMHRFDRDWKKIEDFVGSKTVIQVERYVVVKDQFVSLTTERLLSFNIDLEDQVLLPLQASMGYPSSLSGLAPGYTPWDDTSLFVSQSGEIIPSQDEYDLHGFEGMHASDTGSKGAGKISNISSSGIGSSSREMPTSEVSNPGEQASIPHGIPDFSEVYSFIGSVFDPETKGHVQKLKEMDPINFETVSLDLLQAVLLLMRNLTVNLSNPEFEPM